MSPYPTKPARNPSGSAARMVIVAKAPGKLMLLGEYAVLQGAPALVCAVDRRARVSVVTTGTTGTTGTTTGTTGTTTGTTGTTTRTTGTTTRTTGTTGEGAPAPSGWHRLSSPLLGLDGFPFRLEGGRFVPGARLPPGAGERLTLVERTLEVLSQAAAPPPLGADPGSSVAPTLTPDGWPPLHLFLDTRSLREQQAPGGPKLGLGSSAALTVALVGALRHLTVGRLAPHVRADPSAPPGPSIFADPSYPAGPPAPFAGPPAPPAGPPAPSAGPPAPFAGPPAPPAGPPAPSECSPAPSGSSPASFGDLPASSSGAPARPSTGLHTAPAALFPLAWRAHRTAQGERGSGFDLAAALWGGLLRYRAPAPGQVVPAEVAALAWPADLAMGVVWTGRSADTASLTAGVAAARARRPAAFAAVDADLAVLADQGLTAFGAGRTAEFLQTVRDYDRALHGLGRLAGADIVSGIHRRVGDEAEALGLAYKPAGAGSGDIGVAFGSPAAVTRLKSRLPGLGATLLPLRPGAPGLTVRHE